MIFFNPGTPSITVPSGRLPVASIGDSPSLLRYFPTASKFSSAKPSGSSLEWHDAQATLARCFSNVSRRLLAVVLAVSSRVGTFGGGGGGGAFKILSRIHLPRNTGEVRVGYDVTISTLACVKMPPRSGAFPFSPFSATRRK